MITKQVVHVQLKQISLIGSDRVGGNQSTRGNPVWEETRVLEETLFGRNHEHHMPTPRIDSVSVLIQCALVIQKIETKSLC